METAALGRTNLADGSAIDYLSSMSADSRSLRSRWSEFFGSLRTQISAAFAIGLPADDARASVEPGAGQEGDDPIRLLKVLHLEDERLALVEEDSDTMMATAMLEKIEDIKVHALQLSEQNMEQAIGIIKSWLREPAQGSNLPARAA